VILGESASIHEGSEATIARENNRNGEQIQMDGARELSKLDALLGSDAGST
jgi:hypothetical protein